MICCIVHISRTSPDVLTNYRSFGFLRAGDSVFWDVQLKELTIAAVHLCNIRASNQCMGFGGNSCRISMSYGRGNSSILSTSQSPMGAGLAAGSPPYLPHSQVLYGCWVSWETSLSTTQSGPLWVPGRPPCLPHSQVLYGCWVIWGASLSTTQSGSLWVLG